MGIFPGLHGPPSRRCCASPGRPARSPHQFNRRNLFFQTGESEGRCSLSTRCCNDSSGCSSFCLNKTVASCVFVVQFGNPLFQTNSCSPKIQSTSGRLKDYFPPTCLMFGIEAGICRHLGPETPANAFRIHSGSKVEPTYADPVQKRVPDVR